MWLVCCWVGSRAGWFPVGAVKSFGKPYSIESSLAVGGTCALCYSRHNFQYPIAGNFLGMADGPIWRPKPTGRHSCPAPHWNLGSRAEPLLKTYFRAFLHHRNRNWWHQISCFCCVKCKLSKYWIYRTFGQNIGQYRTLFKNTGFIGQVGWLQVK